jgi:cytochrome c2
MRLGVVSRIRFGWVGALACVLVSGSPVRPAPRSTPAGPALTAAQRGHRLFVRYQCLSCHRLGDSGHADGVDLAVPGAKLRPDWLKSFLKGPGEFPMRRLGYAMPDFQLCDADADDLVAFLSGGAAADRVGSDSATAESVAVSLGSGARESAADLESLEEGKLLFAAYGCASCHRVGSEQFAAGRSFYEGAHAQEAARRAPDLSYAARLNRQWAIEFMEKPGRYVPGTLMFNNGAGRSTLERIYDYLANYDRVAHPQLAGVTR